MIIAVVSDDEVRKIISSRNNVQIESEKTFEREAESLAKQIAFIKAVTQYGIKHTISFHSRVEYARSFADTKSDNGIGAVNGIMKNYEANTPLINAFHVNGTVSSGQRSSIIGEFASSPYSVISNARCLTEGVDIPSVDGVMFYDPKYRLTDIVQATGRALRLYEGKKSGYLIIPVFLNEGEDADDLLESSDFSQAWSVIKAMQSQDDRLDEIIKTLRVMDGQIDGGQKELSGERNSLEEKLNEWVSVQGVPNKISSEQFIEKINIKLLNELGSSWDYHFGLLKAYRLQHPERWPMRQEEFEGHSLGHWCNNQRQLKRGKKGGQSLDERRAQKLFEIGFSFNVLDQRWQDGFDDLKRFRQLNPSRWPKRTRKNSEEIMLGEWCSRQRSRKKEADLTLEQEMALLELGFPFTIFFDQWCAKYELLTAYRKDHPNSWPSKSKHYKGENLGTWCSSQRKALLTGHLTEAQVKMLTDIGFIFETLETRWTRALEKLKAYREQNPSSRPKLREKFQGFALGSWCQRQWSLKKNSKLESYKDKALSEIGFKWLSKEDLWEEGYEKLKVFKRLNPKRAPSRDEVFDGYKLGAWFLAQCLMVQKKRLKRGKVKLLLDAGIEFNVELMFQMFPGRNPSAARLSKTQEEALKRWQEGYEKLKAYQNENPGKLPKRDAKYEGYPLELWCGKQRNLKLRGRLDQEKERMLLEIGFIFDVYENMWKVKYEMLKRFRRLHPHAWPKRKENFEGVALDSWCVRQRQDRRRGQLAEEKIKALEVLGFDFKK